MTSSVSEQVSRIWSSLSKMQRKSSFVYSLEFGRSLLGRISSPKRMSVDNSAGFDMKAVSSNYIKYRPIWPEQLYDKIVSYVDRGSPADRRRGLVVDVGCGSGQSTLPLSKYFRSVVGIDSSETQLAEAKQHCPDHENVEFKLLPAEKLSSVFEDESVDLITAGCALHWFDYKTFFTESLRVLKMGGTLAAFSTTNPIFYDEQVHELIHRQIYRGIFERYWPPGAYYVFNHYKDLFPVMKLYYEDMVRDDSLKFEHVYSIDDIFGMIKSFPQYYYYKSDHPEHPDEVDIRIKKVMDICGITSTQEKVIKYWNPISVIMGRKPSFVS